jgi:hypothetical protein
MLISIFGMFSKFGNGDFGMLHKPAGQSRNRSYVVISSYINQFNVVDSINLLNCCLLAVVMVSTVFVHIFFCFCQNKFFCFFFVKQSNVW